MMRLKHIYTLSVILLASSFVACQQEDLPITQEIEQTQGVHTQNADGLCDQSEAVKAQYEEDAIRLALELGDRNSEPNIYVEGDSYQQAMDALMAIYNAKRLAARDSVFEQYDIHVRADYNLRKITIGLDANYAWTRSWLSGQQITGNSEVDKMVETYRLALAYHDTDRTYVTLEAERPLNIEQLGRLFSEVEGVQYTDQEWEIGEAGHIEMRQIDDHWEVSFSIGYGDCQAGCIFRHYWEFNVFDDCQVEYTGSYGDPAP